MEKHICIFLRLVAYDDLLVFLIDILVCLRVRYGQEPLYTLMSSCICDLCFIAWTCLYACVITLEEREYLYMSVAKLYDIFIT
jgi:hypothetical protein